MADIISDKAVHALIIDDEPLILDVLEALLHEMGVDSTRAENIDYAIKSLRQADFTFCITDLDLPDGTGFDLVHYITQKYPRLPVAVLTGDNRAQSVVTAMQAGAFDYLIKPLDTIPLRNLVTSAIGLCNRNNIPDQKSLLVGQSESIRNINIMAQRLAQTNAPVLITGESGSGKELVARMIHDQSPRRAGPFIAVNCGAIPENLMESEFFGHEKGSFTGADRRKPGLFLAAEGGTIFLDEVADFPLSMQVKMLRVLQERAIRAVGSGKESAIDVRILSASHKNLALEVADGRFREDLYYRVNVISIAVPSLKEHREDIPQLVSTFLARIAIRDGKKFIAISSQAVSLLMSETWPGNVRELSNRLERAVALYQGERIEVQDIRPAASIVSPPQSFNVLSAEISDSLPQLPIVSMLKHSGKYSLDVLLADVEKAYISQALELCKYNKIKTAQMLGLNIRSLRYRIQKLAIDH